MTKNRLMIAIHLRVEHQGTELSSGNVTRSCSFAALARDRSAMSFRHTSFRASAVPYRPRLRPCGS